jgi:hypothetical protein
MLQHLSQTKPMPVPPPWPITSADVMPLWSVQQQLVSQVPSVKCFSVASVGLCTVHFPATMTGGDHKTQPAV